MFDFCHHCGSSIGQNQTPGQTLVCQSCGQTIGVVTAPKQKVVVDAAAEAIQSGAAARCAACSQLVQVKLSGGVRSFVPHFVSGGPRKMCPNSGKPVPGAAAPPVASPPGSSSHKMPAPPPPRQIMTSSGKDLTAFMNREVIRVISCQRDAEPTIEQLTLEYLDKSDRVRIQIDALRDILSSKFQMKAYPAALKRPHLAIWSTATQCVVARKHDQGGYQSVSDAEILEVIEELRHQKTLFW